MLGEESAISLLRKNWRAAVPLTFLFLAAGYFAVREFWRWHGLNSEYSGIKREVDTLGAESEDLNLALADSARPAVLEKEARSKLNFKKEGESVLVVVGEDSFPEEDFLANGIGAGARAFYRESAVWLNLKSWGEYFSL